MTEPLPRERRLAILPLTSIQSEEGCDYFVDGMTEELISVLSRTSGLDVIARTSVMQYRDGTKPIREIADELSVGVVLEGSISRAGPQLRVTVQLIDAATERHLWSDEWDRRLEDVFSIQAEIARSVASALQGALLDNPDELLHREPTSDLSAYDLYLLGRHHLALRSEDGIRKAIQHFEGALDRDSAFALAWSGLADCFLLALLGYVSIPADEAAHRAGEAAEEALALDATLADGHVSLAYLEMQRWSWPPARAGFERALELSPSHAQAMQWYAQYFLYRGEFEQAIDCYERARALDPLSNVILNESGWPFMYLGRIDDAVERSRMVVHRDPENGMAYFNLGNYAERSDRPEEAVTYYRAAAELSARIPFITAFLGMALATMGDRDEAEGIATDMERKAERGTSVATCLGALLIRLGRVDDGLGWLERAIEAREPMALAVDTHFLPLPEVREHPRFESISEQAPEPSMMGSRP